MAYFAGNVHMDPDLMFASADRIAALGSLFLFCAEAILIAVMAWPRARLHDATVAHIKAG